MAVENSQTSPEGFDFDSWIEDHRLTEIKHIFNEYGMVSQGTLSMHFSNFPQFIASISMTRPVFVSKVVETLQKMEREKEAAAAVVKIRATEEEFAVEEAVASQLAELEAMRERVVRRHSSLSVQLEDDSQRLKEAESAEALFLEKLECIELESQRQRALVRSAVQRLAQSVRSRRSTLSPAMESLRAVSEAMALGVAHHRRHLDRVRVLLEDHSMERRRRKREILGVGDAASSEIEGHRAQCDGVIRSGSAESGPAESVEGGTESVFVPALSEQSLGAILGHLGSFGQLFVAETAAESESAPRGPPKGEAAESELDTLRSTVRWLRSELGRSESESERLRERGQSLEAEAGSLRQKVRGQQAAIRKLEAAMERIPAANEQSESPPKAKAPRSEAAAWAEVEKWSKENETLRGAAERQKTERQRQRSEIEALRNTVASLRKEVASKTKEAEQRKASMERQRSEFERSSKEREHRIAAMEQARDFELAMNYQREQRERGKKVRKTQPKKDRASAREKEKKKEDDARKKRAAAEKAHSAIVRGLELKFKKFNGREYLEEYCRVGGYAKPTVTTEYIGKNGKSRIARRAKEELWQCTISIATREGAQVLRHAEHSKVRRNAETRCFHNLAARVSRGNIF